MSVEGHVIQPWLRVEDGGTSLWLEPCEGNYQVGLCIGTGRTKAEAIADAREGLRRAAEQLDRLEAQP